MFRSADRFQYSYPISYLILYLHATLLSTSADFLDSVTKLLNSVAVAQLTIYRAWHVCHLLGYGFETLLDHCYDPSFYTSIIPPLWLGQGTGGARTDTSMSKWKFLLSNAALRCFTVNKTFIHGTAVYGPWH